MADPQAPDLLVVGAGLAGLAAAIRCAELGLRAHVLDAEPGEQGPSNTRFSGGVFHVAFRSMRAPAPDLMAAIAAITDGFVRPDVAALLADNAGRAADWLVAQGIEFGRIEPDEGWRDTILKPLGYHDRTRLEWRGSGADVMLGRLEAKARGHGVVIERNARAIALLREGGQVAGVRLADGRTLRSRAVLLADGGFQGSPDLLRAYVTPWPERLRQRGAGNSRGEGIVMAREAGAELVGMDIFYGHLLSIDSLHNDELWPFPFIDFLAGAGVLVDRSGNRFLDEGRGGVAMANAVARHEAADPPVAIFDAAIWDEAGRHFFAPPNPHLVRAGGTLHRAETLAEVARAAGLPEDAVLRSLAAHNAALAANCLAGLTPPRSNAKGLARPIATAPFFAAPARAAISHTMGGIRIDNSARALRADGSAIPGLYAAGNAAGGLEGGPRCGYVGGLAIALITGLAAAESLRP
jgi:fumarate reductase flavoprotein subunit